MSKIKNLINKVASATSSKRSSLKSPVSGEEAVHTAGQQNAVGFAGTNEEVHPSNGAKNHGHGRRRNRTLSLTDERILRSEARETVEEEEKRQHDAEKKKAYDEVSHLLMLYCALVKYDCT